MTAELIVGLISLGLALTSGLVSGVSNVINKKENDAAQQAQLEDNLALMDAQFKQEKASAERQAADYDTQTDLAEALQGSSINNEVQQLGQQQSNNALSYMEAEQSIESNKGNALTEAAASGTRGSSTLQAAEYQNVNSYNSLAAQKETNDLASAIELQNVSLQAANTLGQNQVSRDKATYLRDYYKEFDIKDPSTWSNWGKEGEGTKLYRKQRSNYVKANAPDTSTKSYVSAFFGGASSGFTAGAQLGETASKWVPYFVS